MCFRFPSVQQLFLLLQHYYKGLFIISVASCRVIYTSWMDGEKVSVYILVIGQYVLKAMWSTTLRWFSLEAGGTKNPYQSKHCYPLSNFWWIKKLEWNINGIFCADPFYSSPPQFAYSFNSEHFFLQTFCLICPINEQISFQSAYRGNK